MLENGLMVPVESMEFTGDIEINNFVKEYENHEKDIQMLVDKKIISDDRVKEMIKLEYESEIEHNIRYEISKYLQLEENKEDKDRILKF